MDGQTVDVDKPFVALLAEGVGRNMGSSAPRNMIFCVALLAEGVGRNDAAGAFACSHAASPSSRRAWVEIFYVCHLLTPFYVALLAEGVGRNMYPAAGGG